MRHDERHRTARANQVAAMKLEGRVAGINFTEVGA